MVRRKKKLKREALKEADRLAVPLAQIRRENEGLRVKNARLENAPPQIWRNGVEAMLQRQPTNNRVGRRKLGG